MTNAKAKSVSLFAGITGRKQTEKALQETNEYLDDLNKKLTASLTQRDSAIDELSDSKNYIETIMNTSVSGIFVVDEQGKFNFGNEAFSRILGWPMDELIGEPFMKVMPEDKHELMQKHWDDIQNGIIEPYETVIVTKNGTRRDIFVSHKDLKMKGEKIYVVSMNDITERKQAEEELNKYREHLEELIKERTVELNKKNTELERFNKLFVGRELRIIGLKEKVAELENEIKTIEKSNEE